MNNSSSSNADPSSRSPVVYRLSRRGWLLVAQGTVWVALCFWFATSTCFNVGSVPRGEEIARHRADNNAPLVWMAFSLGTVLLGLLPFQVWPLLFFRLEAGEVGRSERVAATFA